ncbi:S-adenosyl-L-methionine-dependent methyltransferase [Geopyxis carbonaria]|nr:S-adenosyl-L-methionine-dependent methyltransferase [Geopyxis carbonaria]
MSTPQAQPTSQDAKDATDHWSPHTYTHSVAPFVAQLTTALVTLLAPQPTDSILDLGCGDGVLTAAIAPHCASITGVDSSVSMLSAVPASIRTFCCSATSLPASLRLGAFTKAVSNAALHWILAAPETRAQTMQGIFEALAPGGALVAEMGAAGNVAEVHAALAGALLRRGVAVPQVWWFPEEAEMRELAKGAGFVWEHGEVEYRPTVLPEGGVRGWVELFGARFLEAIEEGERAAVVREVCEQLEWVGRRADGRFVVGYVRLRFVARKPAV